MPVYNGSSYLNYSIESILNQTYRNFEFIIIDDQSLDNTSEIIQKFSSSDGRIIFLQNGIRLGLAASLNRGINISKGEYIARMDADDISFNNRISDQVKFLQENPNVDVLGTNAICFDRKNNNYKEILVRKEFHIDIVSNIYKISPFIHSSIIAKRQFFLDFGGYDSKLKRCQDYDLWIRTSHLATFHNLQNIYLKYHRNSYKLFDLNYSIKIFCKEFNRTKNIKIIFFMARFIFATVYKKIMFR